MSREIKFRAKSIETEKWIYGTYLELGAGLHYIIPLLRYHPISESDYEKYQVDPETIGQFVELAVFSSLKDKKGKEIFEGDIVELDGEQGMVFIIIWSDENLGFMLEDTHLPNYTKSYENEELEVIGNIYDNQDLVGGKNET